MISSTATYVHALRQLQDTEIADAITVTMNNVLSILANTHAIGLDWSYNNIGDFFLLLVRHGLCLLIMLILVTVYIRVSEIVNACICAIYKVLS